MKLRPENTVDKAVVCHHIVGVNRVAVGVLDKNTHIVVVGNTVKAFYGKFVSTPARENVICNVKDILYLRSLVA